MERLTLLLFAIKITRILIVNKIFPNKKVLFNLKTIMIIH